MFDGIERYHIGTKDQLHVDPEQMTRIALGMKTRIKQKEENKRFTEVDNFTEFTLKIEKAKKIVFLGAALSKI